MKKFRDTKKRQLLAITTCLFLIITSFSSFAISQSTPLTLQENKDSIGLSYKDYSFVPEETVVRLLASDESGLIIKNTIDRDDLKTESVQIGEECYQRFVLPGYVSTMEVGKPQIPIKPQMVAVPESVDVNLEILSSTYITLSGITLYPVPEMVERTSPEGYADYDEAFTIDKVCYATDTFYPGPLVEISGFSHIRDQRVVQLVFQPFQYNPVTCELRVYTSIQVKIQYSSPADLVIQNVGPLESIYSDLIVNYEPSQMPSLDYQRGTLLGSVSYPSSLSNPTNADYLIITSNKFYNPAKQDHDAGTLNNKLNALAHWRAAYNGFDVAIVNINNSFIGGNTDTNIKDFIEYVFTNWQAPHMSDGHVGYVLLVGDTPFVATHIIGEAAVDRWFVCIGDEDYSTPDIMIGRFSVDNQAELDVIAEKTVHYEQTYSDTDEWHKKVMMAAGAELGYLFEAFWYSTAKEILLGCGGWNVSEVFADEGGTSDDMIENIKNGTGILVYVGHGGPTGWDLLCSTQIPLLANGDKLPLVYSMSCLTGRFQGSDDCFGEIFVNTPDKGAVAFLGASVSTSNIFYSNYLFPSLFEHFEYILGRIILEAIMQLGSAGMEYNLLGDPALDLSGSKGYSESGKPDLALSHLNITIDPALPQPGDEVNITATILNIGGGTAENVAVRFIIVDYNNTQYIIGDETVSSVSPGGSCMVHHLWDTSVYYGKYSLIVQIDPENTIDESFELNNQAGIIILPSVTYVNATYDEATPGMGETHFNRIQDGINGVAETGTVFVSQGTYQEHIIITKPVHLLGEDMASTFIDGSQNLPAVRITSTNEVTITGFTIRNSNYGVRLDSVQGTAISGNIISDNRYGLSLSESTGNTVSNNYFVNDGVGITDSYDNTFSGNTINGRPLVYLEDQSDVVIDTPGVAGQVILIRCTNITVQNQDISNTDTGITLLETTQCHITGNIISNNSDSGIGLYSDSNTNTISENIISNNNYYGIDLFSSYSNTISWNTITYNYDGIYLVSSNINTISGNTITNNYNGIDLFSSTSNTILGNTISNNSISGIGLHSDSSATISGNTITYNYYGIDLVSSNSNTISGNTITYNYDGICLSLSSSNTISENIISNNINYGICLTEPKKNKNCIYHNNFINNTQNAYDECNNNIWYNPDLKAGNFWDDYTGSDANDDGMGDSPYNISGGSNQDLYPLMAPYYPLPDLIITNVFVEYLTSNPSEFSARYTGPLVKLTVTIKNNGTLDITTPFQVSFYDHNNHQLESVLIPSLAAGTTKNISINTMVDPAITAVLAVADSTHVVSESNETNNQATISLPHHILWKSLTETTEVYKKLGDQYKVPSAEKVVRIAKDGLTKGVYLDPVVFMRTLKTVAELEGDVGWELKGQVQPALLQRYQDIVKHLMMVIDSIRIDPDSHKIIWDDPQRTSEIQLQICEIVSQMVK
ncbi:MAG: C25 family cysteine peptidase [Euryarchaeota archaeon]|nr:C25 family cysteine peptidase [Euryarchaeota archaeon]